MSKETPQNPVQLDNEDDIKWLSDFAADMDDATVPMIEFRPDDAARFRSIARKLRVLELKDRHSLANNLCPDHRDKQKGKTCLACEIERLERSIAARLERPAVEGMLHMLEHGEWTVKMGYVPRERFHDALGTQRLVEGMPVKVTINPA